VIIIKNTNYIVSQSGKNRSFSLKIMG